MNSQKYSLHCDILKTLCGTSHEFFKYNAAFNDFAEVGSPQYGVAATKAGHCPTGNFRGLAVYRLELQSISFLSRYLLSVVPAVGNTLVAYRPVTMLMG